MKKAVILSGWAQDPDALVKIIPPGMRIYSVDYTAMDKKSLWNNLRNIGDVDIIVGWSLGGQLAARAIANKLLKTKLLVLLGVPFAFVADEGYAEAKKYFALSPKEMLRGYAELCMAGDVSDNILPFYNVPLNYVGLLADWLDILENFDCNDLNFSDFPKTIIIHGDSDAVITPNQSEEFAWRIRGSEFLQWQGCGHAPHMHNPERCRKAIISAMRRPDKRG